MYPLFFRFKPFIELFILFALMTGCQSFGTTLNKPKGASDRHTILQNHVVMFNEDGHPVDPTGNSDCQTDGNTPGPSYCTGKHSVLTDYPRLTTQDFQHHIANIIQSAKQQALNHNQSKVQLLFFIHGGLNTQVGSLERIIDKGHDPDKNNQTLFDLITTESPFYPVFINWQSSLRASYLDHLLYVRQGEKWPALAGWLTAPVVLAVDIGRSLLRAPLVWGSMIYNDAKTAPALTKLLGNEQNLPDEIVKELLCQDHPDREACETHFTDNKAPATFSDACWSREANKKTASIGDNLIVGVDDRRCPEMGWKFFQWLVTLPTKLVISPFLDAFGKSAWDNMLRSIQLLYQTEEDFHLPTNPSEALTHRSPTGGLSIFFQELAKEIHAQDARTSGTSAPLEWEITWVGHSMGTIIINEAIRRFGLPPNEPHRLPFSKIVYMAAAATLGDLDSSVYDYLQTNPHTTFYHLMLHEKAEEGETVWNQFDLPPRGSLLVWIDEFLSNPLTHKERTAGKYQNFFRDYSSIPERIRPQISVRVFSQGERIRSGNPLKHGEFTDRFRFWDSTCWATDLNQTTNACVYSEK